MERAVILRLYRENLTDMKRLFNIFLLSLLCISCTREVLQTTYVDLGKKTVGVEAGNFPVKVSMDCVWYAESDSPWITVDNEFHAPEGTVQVSYGSNVSSEGDWRFSRIGVVHIKSYDGAIVGIIHVWQKGLSPVICFDETVKVSLTGGPYLAPCTTTLTDIERPNISLTSAEDWIGDLKWGHDGRSVEFTVREASESREGVVYVRHTDAWGEVTEVSFKVRQGV